MKFRLVAGLGESLEVDESSSHLVVSLDWRVWNGLTAFCTKAFYSCRSSARAGEMEMEGEGHVWVMALALGAGPGCDALWAVFSCPSKVYSAHGSQRDFFFLTWIMLLTCFKSPSDLSSSPAWNPDPPQRARWKVCESL